MSKVLKQISAVLVVLVSWSVISCSGGGGSDGDDSSGDFLGTEAYQGEYWPTEAWRTCQPEEVGMNSERLMAVYRYAANWMINTEGILVVKDGYIVGEAYFGDFTADTPHRSYSVAKSFTSALVGIAIDQGYIENVDARVNEFLTQWQSAETPEGKKQMTVENLLTMSSGLQWNEGDYYVNPTVTDPWLMNETSNWVDYVLAKELVCLPGECFYYSSGNSMVLSGIIEAATGMSTYEFARQHLLEPIGLESIEWWSDPAGQTIGGWGIQATVREFAKFGLLYLHNGQWDGQQVVPESWVAASTQPASETVTHYGYQWWFPSWRDYYFGENSESYGLPRQTFMAMGAFGQYIFVVPEHNLVVLRVGNDNLASEPPFPWHELEFLRFVINAVN